MLNEDLLIVEVSIAVPSVRLKKITQEGAIYLFSASKTVPVSNQSPGSETKVQSGWSQTTARLARLANIAAVKQGPLIFTHRSNSRMLRCSPCVFDILIRARITRNARFDPWAESSRAEVGFHIDNSTERLARAFLLLGCLASTTLIVCYLFKRIPAPRLHLLLLLSSHFFLQYCKWSPTQ